MMTERHRVPRSTEPSSLPLVFLCLAMFLVFFPWQSMSELLFMVTIQAIRDIGLSFLFVPLCLLLAVQLMMTQPRSNSSITAGAQNCDTEDDGSAWAIIIMLGLTALLAWFRTALEQPWVSDS
ncbi:hypothetical protein O6H91_08G030200 [Diphasiastrum complanatum]|uniref:Uncharacterized protein n=1 Tax=Diphasiastrum complanatum TaxID=34168 RepID=A0ACC2CWF2_DIPCM|nr:hypothetical protein O6H91_Y451200 [Diphasiastrum complanatum]KAJ7546218.1 hypothetical protein O6H91_08G030200 [Diphasiastrum complanatum]